VRRSPRVYCGISSLSANSSSLCRQMLLKTGETTPPCGTPLSVSRYTFVGPSIDDAITAFRAEQRFMNDRYDMPMWAGSKMENGNTGTETAGGIRVAVKRE
jgi:hypothetical protein